MATFTRSDDLQGAEFVEAAVARGWSSAPELWTALACLHVVLQEEREHHRFAVRDLDAIEA
jgi:hypothetical protein